MDSEKQAQYAEDEIESKALHFLHKAEASHVSDAVSERSRLQRKIDMRLMPLLCLTYAIQSIDKTTLSYAAVFGIREDTHLQGTEYSWAGALFYLGYLFWEYPTNVLLQKLPVGKFMSGTVILWGITLMLHTPVQSFAGLAAVRTLLGVFEASVNPATMIIFSMYYKRQEQPVRMGIWIGSAGVGYVVAGITSFGIGHIDSSSLESWRLQFLVWGAVTTAWGVLLWLLLPGSPVSAGFLSEEEKVLVMDRIKDNGTGVENRRFKVVQFREAMLDLKTWLLFIFAVSSNCPNGGLTTFQGLIIKGFGFTTLQTTLIQMPSGGIQAIVCVTACYIVSKYKNARLAMMLICLTPFLAGITGLVAIADSKRYARLVCLWISFSYTATWTLSMSVATANTSGHTKRVTTNAMLLIGYCVGNFVGPFFFKTSEAPSYGLGVGMMFVCIAVQVLCIVGIWVLLWWRNRMKERPVSGEEWRRARENGFADLTDLQNGYFRYVY
ncbi:major facilitator superfamily transporter [Pseudovirgaria hyperparasitica]|uniref:Major facilitator superfamily transporter n=1 Tax=Pseudovirgaria hyperparasitica TaxID=470096 RepID=A0A6A6VW73_9PEZI|nr:major facilitator superfamily transporter [Pseudovirgaria hyperparasitica]KAF2753497.1 major facilitator superfamily transporter [Pseudovirgaria hyperparasitica]